MENTGQSMKSGSPALESAAWAPVTTHVYSMEMWHAPTFYSAESLISQVTEYVSRFLNSQLCYFYNSSLKFRKWSLLLQMM